MKRIRTSLSGKLILAVITLLLIPLVAINVVAYRQSNAAVQEQLLSFNRSMLETVADQVTEYFAAAEKGVLSLYGNQKIMNSLHPPYDLDKQYTLRRGMTEVLGNYSMLEGLIFRLRDGPVVYVLTAGASRGVFLTLNTDPQALMDEADFDDILTVLTDGAGRPQYYAYNIRLNNEPLPQPLVDVIALIRHESVESLITSAKNPYFDSETDLVLGRGRGVYQGLRIAEGGIDTGAEDLGDTPLPQRADQVCLYAERAFRGVSIQVASFTPRANLEKKARDVVSFLIPVQLCALVFIALFVLSNYRITIEPIQRILKNIENVCRGKFEYTVPPERRDELGVLEARYSDMVHSIDTLINENYRGTLEVTRARLKMLQAQIHPHFLNNMLQAIATSALKRGAPEVSEQIAALGRLFQYNLNAKQEVVTVREEVRQIQDYIDLQKIRFGDRIAFLLRCQDAALDETLPPMILQPLVENSILHGIEPGGAPGRIEIEIGKEEKGPLRLCIRDDGQGMDEETLAALAAAYERYDTAGPLDQSDGIGLMNVLVRLRLFTHGRFVWNIQSEAGGWTAITLQVGGEEEACAS